MNLKHSSLHSTAPPTAPNLKHFKVQTRHTSSSDSVVVQTSDTSSSDSAAPQISRISSSHRPDQPLAPP
ncbi:hypothetical protein ACOSQ4_003285 [Xanthoceras sorbifolium]